MARRHVFSLLLLAPLIVGGCQKLPGASVQCLAQCGSGTSGSLREFVLTQTGHQSLSFPASSHVALLLSASGSVPSSPVDFRVQGARPGTEAALSDSWRWSGPLSLYGPRPQGRFVQTIPTALDMWINTGDSTAQGDCLRHVVQVYHSAHAYYYVDEGPGAGATGNCAAPAGILPSQDQMRLMAASFEGGFPDPTDPVPGAPPTYSTVTGLFGVDPADDSPPAGDPVFVVLSPAVDDFGAQHGLLGYFWERDMQAPVDVAGDPRQHSNQRPVVFLTDQIFTEKPYTTYGTLAHEFTHLVVYYQRTKAGVGPNETWWNEAEAMLSMNVCGYGFKAGNEDMAKDLQSFLQQPGAYSLTEWNQDPNGFAYGLVSVFARYLYDRFGPQFIEEVNLAPDGGVGALDAALRQRGTTFEQVYEDFMVAVYASSKGIALGGVWQLAPDLDMRGKYGSIQLSGVQAQAGAPGGAFWLPPWGTQFFELTQTQAGGWNFDLSVPGPYFGSGISF